MKLSKIDEYASQIPKEIRKAIGALGHDARCAIIVDLVQKGELTFTQLKDDLDIDPKLLSSHLKTLMDGAMVEHYFKHEIGNEQYSYYNLTLFGKDILQGILEPLKSIQQVRKLPTIPTLMPVVTTPHKRRYRYRDEYFPESITQRGSRMVMQRHADKSKRRQIKI